MNILCASAMKEIVKHLRAQIERAAGEPVVVEVGEAGDLRRRLERGERAELVLLPRPMLDQLHAAGLVGDIADVAASTFGIGVRSGPEMPDISSRDGLRKLLLTAERIATTDPASGGVAGVHAAGVFDSLGIADQLKPRLKLTRTQRNAEFVARGEADIAIQLGHEIKIVPGIAFIPFEGEFGGTVMFSAAVPAEAGASRASRSVVELFTRAEADAVIRERGMEPARR